MISIIAFIITMFGCLNWLSIGLFQYDLVAGLFGYQGSIFSRMVYIIVGISACWLIFAVIKNKGRLNAKKLKHDERPLYNKQAKQEQVLRDIQEENQTSENPRPTEPAHQESQPEVLTRSHDNVQV